MLRRRDKRKGKKLVEARSPHGADGAQPLARLLETHRWHAKRMKMVSAHGWVVAECRSDRGLRAAWRSASLKCVIQDASMERPIELTGDILAALKCLVDPTRQFAGNFSTVIHSPHRFPACAIGMFSLQYQTSQRRWIL